MPKPTIYDDSGHTMKRVTYECLDCKATNSPMLFPGESPVLSLNCHECHHKDSMRIRDQEMVDLHKTSFRAAQAA
jgi:hypothetical protein